MWWLRFNLMPWLRDRARDKNTTKHNLANRLEETKHFRLSVAHAIASVPLSGSGSSLSTNGITMLIVTRLAKVFHKLVCPSRL
jgi:hypothetical protein